MITNCLQQPQLSSLIAKEADQLPGGLKHKSPEASLLGSDWPTLGQVPTIESMGRRRPAAATHAERQD